MDRRPRSPYFRFPQTEVSESFNSMGNHTPLFDQHVRMGGKIVDFAGWEMPINYGSQIEEHHAVRCVMEEELPPLPDLPSSSGIASEAKQSQLTRIIEIASGCRSRNNT